MGNPYPSPVPPRHVDEESDGEELQSGTMPVARPVDAPAPPPPVRPISRPHLRAALVRQTLRSGSLSEPPPAYDSSSAIRAVRPDDKKDDK
jgi:hypothetical protein